MTGRAQMSTSSVDAEQLHREAIFIDGVDVSVLSPSRLERMRAAGLTAVCVTVAIYENCKETIRNIAVCQQMLDQHDHLTRPINTVDDIRTAKEEDRVGVIYALQNTSPIEDEFAYIEVFQRLGVRVVQLAYMYQNLVGAGCLEPRDSGLTSYGKDVVRELNRHGMTIDLSHCGMRTAQEAVDVSDRPVVFTHAAARSLIDSPRNRTDDELKRVAESGGVIGIVAFPTFIAQQEPSIDDWFLHLEHVLGLVGPDHVSVGTDFIEGQPEGFADRAYYRRPHPPGLVPKGWPWPYPVGIASVDDYPNITEGLARRGYDEETIRKILGRNLLRVFEATWVA
jgi:membrane dipeptidase